MCADTRPILQVQNLTKVFGGIVAVDSVSFDVAAGEILAVIGPNGAGKTTLFNLISGLTAPTRGAAQLDGQNLTRLKPHRRAALGLARTFQNLRLFENMTVLENVLVGRHQHAGYGLAAAALRLPLARRMEKQLRAEALARLEQIGLADRAADPIGALPFGQQRLVQIARALATAPRLLLLDEPAAGLTRSEIQALAELIRKLAAEGLTLLIVEHDMPLIMHLAHRVVVLNYGDKIAEGPPAAIQRNPKVIAAYLGETQALEPRAAPAAADPAAPPLLEVKNISAYYGSLQALADVNLEVAAGEIVALVGANGAGKTTLLRAIAGLLTPRAGQVFFAGQNITHWPAENVAAAGLSLVPERRQIFTTLSVRDNLRLGAFGRRSPQAEIEADLQRIFELFPILKKRTHQAGGTLSGGEQQMLAIGRGLMARPRLLMLDEPSVGLAPLLVREILRIVKELCAQGTTILLIEQNAQAALEVADRAYVCETGRLVLSGPAQDLINAASVQRAYLGGNSA